ncbi:2-keto-3-deoxygluconate permease [Anaerocolumna sp. MB42-C2]|uniref:2-keto-3-deoxygluconate permease n=1 Tax=Anaerocolumna sp. MB42-C2 TaxID=3070997 RepID=UPI0027DF4BF3|nr:2-keto-3-deoxygluconate permease [Anaerocolumna sp. MB42-C2]WMJ89470.1 2-keto-3-deoxygluconate permease [Anaerocolumna sp. MB42-C2]
MQILNSIKKIPGGLMVVPLLLGAVINTFLGNSIFGLTSTGVWDWFDGTFTTYLFKTGAMPILAVFLFCNATTIDFKKAGVPLYKGCVLTVTKVGLGIIIGLIIGKLAGPNGILGLAPIAIVGAIANSNGGLYAALAGEYGDATDVGAVSILSINDGPFFTMVALGAAGVAKIPITVLIGCVIPIVIGCILGNLDEDIRKFCAPGANIMIPFFAFPLGAGLNLMNLIKAGVPGILLGVFCTLFTGIGGYLIYKLLKMEHPEVGAAIGTTAGNAAATPAAVAAADATLLVVAEAATVQITAAIIVTAILCPILTSYLHKVEDKKRVRA